jgi:acyl-CoA dehydrogenase
MRRSDTPEEAAFRREVRSWLEANASRRTGGVSDWSLGPADASDEAERAYWQKMKAWQRAKFDGGWAAITWPVEHSGRGGTPAQQLIFNEEQAAFDVTTGYIDAAVGLIGPALIRFGTDEQRARYLKPMLRGDEIWCQLFSEPDAGSDRRSGPRARNMRTSDSSSSGPIPMCPSIAESPSRWSICGSQASKSARCSR